MQALWNTVRDDHQTIRIYLDKIDGLRRERPQLCCAALRELLAFVAARDAALAEVLPLAGAPAHAAQALQSRRRTCRHALFQGLRMEPDSAAWWSFFADGRRRLLAGMRWEEMLLRRMSPPRDADALLDAYVDRRERLLPHARAQLQRLQSRPQPDDMPLRAAA
jgi:hypothetical protein